MSSPTLSKTCSICGLLKPLSAFLQLGGPQGASYGIICASCRSAGLDKKKPKEAEDSTSSTSGRKVDSKSKVESEVRKREERLSKEDKHYEELEKDAKTDTKKSQTTQRIAEEQKDHRERWLKRGFLDANKNKSAQTNGDSPIERALNEQIPDYTKPVEEGRVTGKIGLTSAERAKFAAWLPGSSEVHKRFHGQKNTQKNKQSAEKPASETALTDALEKKFRPKTR